MDPIVSVLLFLFGALGGAGLIWLFLKKTATAAGETEKALLNQSLERTAAELEQVRAELAAKAAEASELALKYRESETRREDEATAAAEKLAVLDKAEKQLREAFQALSSEALRSNNESFLKLAKESLEKFQQGAQGDLDKRQAAINQLVNPVRESLEKFNTQIGQLEEKRVAAYEGLTQQVQGLLDAQRHLGTETGNLVRALRAPQVRGRWGEMQLRRCVEFAGMVSHCDFTEQENATTDEGRMLRPDMIVRLPNGRQIVVDAKMTFDAFGEAILTEDPDRQRDLLKKHARQVRDQLKKLGEKAYWRQFEPTPEFVVLFLPTESFFSAALEQDSDLIEYGSEQRVILATPTTLIALLKAVAYGWRQEEIAREARAISELGRDLYSRLGTLAGYFDEMRRGLERANDGYNKAVASMESRVLVTARKFKDLHVSTDTEIAETQPVEKILREPAADELRSPSQELPDTSEDKA
ncbi:DNA recombination protein RmuC [Ruficoccus sp. ZRK36]|uniref:DNA recombination protein RmuC n=1 Tax=Ruficoccus sp. ZRK36 TaxID=2866311 RepID=UPI001C72FA29|nr:DNA recombination protein RmuC [Ruficoccus sp. ZRK36]QYY36923.1 DNA recombination protein RmuC [Ruficoccus sp. ZRK36]